MEAIDKLRDLSKKLEDPYFIKEFEEGFEKFLKERDMKFYHTETQQDYDALMSELEEKSCEWRSGVKPTQLDKFKDSGKDTCVYEEYGEITISNVECFKKYHSDETLIEYKVRGEKMTKNENVKYLMFDTTNDVGLLSFKIISENLDEFKTHVLKYLLDTESDAGYIELVMLNPDNSVERLEL